ncbi:MAG: hypothetical protein U5R06_13875 [candidate division KSB1 bacterium]|nr:hypothetical protein [candidate division KSB1 bacterium]
MNRKQFIIAALIPAAGIVMSACGQSESPHTADAEQHAREHAAERSQQPVHDHSAEKYAKEAQL